MADSVDKKACCVCLEWASKYKCPRCRKPFCSVKCNKVHKEECKGQPNENGAKVESRLCEGDLDASSRPLGDEKIEKKEVIGDVARIIDVSQTSKLEKSSYLRNMVSGSKRLRESIAAIDNAGDARERSDALRKLRSNKDFDEFVIKMVKEVE